nr:hypothetical protein [uncultured Oribacterium sp.]
MTYTDLTSTAEDHASDRYNQIQEKQELLSMLLEGKSSGEKEGWFSSEEVKIILRRKQ